MGLFSKKEEKKKDSEVGELPQLPDFPKLDDYNFNSELPQLPSFPDSSMGNKFSQSTIKQAVTGKKMVEEEFDEKDFADYEPDEEVETNLQKPLVSPKKVSFRQESGSEEMPQMIRRTEPLFIRIDKFEESIEIIKKTKNQIGEIEKMLSDIKEIKDKEAKELEYWESEIRSIKDRIEKINSNLFSRIE